MYWSAAMSLKAPAREKTTPNYGSFGAPKTLTAASRTSSGSNIRIPQSIPEHQCLLQFSSPRLHQYEEEKLAEYFEMEQAAQTYSSGGSTTVTVTASSALKMLLLGKNKFEHYSSSSTTSSTASTSSESSYVSSSSDHSCVEMHDANNLHHSSSASTNQNSAALFSYLNGSFASETSKEIAAARAAGEDDDQINYWMLERERLRAKRERRHLLSKKAALSGDVAIVDDEPASAWRTGAIMCSVPLVLVILFAIFVLVAGESGASAVAPSTWELIVSTVTGKASDSTSDSLSDSVRAAERDSMRTALRGSG